MGWVFGLYIPPYLNHIVPQANLWSSQKVQESSGPSQCRKDPPRREHQSRRSLVAAFGLRWGQLPWLLRLASFLRLVWRIQLNFFVGRRDLLTIFLVLTSATRESWVCLIGSWAFAPCWRGSRRAIGKWDLFETCWVITGHGLAKIEALDRYLCTAAQTDLQNTGQNSKTQAASSSSPRNH